MSKKIARTKTKAPAKRGGDDFESVAKRLECDPDKASFEAKLGKLAKAKPMSEEHKAAREKPDKGPKR